MKVYTSGEAAKIAQVAPRTIAKWFDSCGLNGYLVPGTRHRRIPADRLLEFMQSHGMSIPKVLAETVKEFEA